MHTLVLLASLLSAAQTSPEAAKQAPVVVELFTSEGCSSCPPADKLLSELGRRPNVITLNYHVDYWDQLGWADRFADAAFTTRQQQYARTLRDTGGHGGIYTPMMVVQGESSFVGSNRTRAAQKVGLKRKALPGVLKLKPQRNDRGLQVTVSYVGPIDGGLVLAVVEDGLITRVKRGENGGRTLRHDAVVRSFHQGSHSPDQPIAMKLPTDLQMDNARLVGFVQRADGTLLGVAQVPLGD